MIIDQLLQKDILPDFLIRLGINYLLKSRIRNEHISNPDELMKYNLQLVEELRKSAVALNTKEANEQHYEVPAEFFEIVLGPWLKYSSGLWLNNNESLRRSEEDMLKLTIDRADIKNGMSILDLGCGWGSFSLYAAELYPESDFTAVSNSSTQKAFIDKRANERGINNLQVITADINEFNTDHKFERIVSVEFFEHVRNYDDLFNSVYEWLTDDGKIFIHIFSHKNYAYKFETKDKSDWMARHFFTGGMMPSDDLFTFFTQKFKSSEHWKINGNHYAKTLETWLQRMDDNQEKIMELFTDTYGKEAKKFWAYWRIFFMACAETFAFNKGDEWGVSHYTFQKSK